MLKQMNEQDCSANLTAKKLKTQRALKKKKSIEEEVKLIDNTSSN